MSIILSIKPKYIPKIFSGEKKVEFRKKIWTKKIQKVYIYASGPIGQIVGSFLIDDIFKTDVKTLWHLCKEFGGISKEDFDLYFHKIFQGNAISIKEPIKFKKPIDPFEIDSKFKAPQNFIYVRKEFEKKLQRAEVKRNENKDQKEN